jgi:hypothetical protein
MTELAPDSSGLEPFSSQSIGSGQPEQPFPIRGHHIETLTQLMKRLRYTPESLAIALTRESVVDRGSLTAQTVDFSILASPESDARTAFWATYAYDLVGETDDQAETYKANVQAAMEGFLSLEDDAPVELLANGKDRICNACTFKQHCEQFPTDNDSLMLGVFEDVVRQFSPTDSNLTRADRSEDGNSITTNARTVRRAMGYFALAGRGWSNDLYRDARERRDLYGDVFGGPDQSKVETYHMHYGHELE